MRTKPQSSQRKMSCAGMMITLAVIIMCSGWQKAAAQQQWNANGNDISNANTGNVGVGTTTPGSKLDVNGRIRQTGSATDLGYLLTNSSLFASTTALNPGIAFFGGNGVNALYGADLGYNSTTSRYRTRIFSGNSLADVALGRQQDVQTNPTQSAFLEFLTIRGDTGNVGIGTNAPSVKLELHHSSSNTNLANLDFPDLALGIRNTSNTNGNMSLISFQDSTGYGNAQIGAIQNNQTTHVADIVFITRNAGAFGERMRIRSDGNVGIGTNAPAYKLDVQGGQVNATGGLCIAGDCKTAWSQVGGGSGAVSSVFGRTGAVVAAPNDYTWAQINKTTSSLGDLTTRNAGDLNVGTVPIGRIGLSGNAGVSTFLRGDNTWGPVPSSQWTSGTNNISYSSGNVGMGTTTPSAGLDVQNPVTGATAYGVRLQQALTAGDNNADLNGLFINTTFIDGMAAGVRHNALVTGAGNIGFGTSGTGAGLDVQNVGVPTSGTTTFGARFQQPLPSAGNNSVSTAVYINPIFNDGMAVGVRHNGLVVAAGDVGIGTPTPGAKLEVVGNVNVTGTGNITAAGTIEAGNIKAKYQDVAEWVKSSQELPTGTLVVLDHTKSNQVIASSQAYDTRVAGVISAQPGIALGESGDNKVLVATTGRVRLRVDTSNGPIQIGDLLVTSDIPGVAMKSEAVEFAGRKMHMPGTIIGKALEPLAKGSGEILVLLSLQ